MISTLNIRPKFYFDITLKYEKNKDFLALSWGIKI